MANANRQSSVQNSIPGAAIIAAGAGTLILLGIVLQMCELGYSHSGPGGAWLFSVLASGIWNILVLRMNLPWVQELLRFWPLVLVGTGLAVLLLSRKNGLWRGQSTETRIPGRRSQWKLTTDQATSAGASSSG